MQFGLRETVHDDLADLRDVALLILGDGELVDWQIIDLDLQRRRISLSIKQAAEGGELAAEYREHFDVDDEGNWTHSEEQMEAAWAEYENSAEPVAAAVEEAPAADAESAEQE